MDKQTDDSAAPLESGRPSGGGEMDDAGEWEEAKDEGAEYELKYDESSEAYYYLAASSGASYWALADPYGAWMEMRDEASGAMYHLHSETGETKWAEEGSEVGEDGKGAASPPQTVWEEMRDPITGYHYYFSNASGTSQWGPPAWMDFVDPDSGVVYYLHGRSGKGHTHLGLARCTRRPHISRECCGAPPAPGDESFYDLRRSQSRSFLFSVSHAQSW